MTESASAPNENVKEEQAPAFEVKPVSDSEPTGEPPLEIGAHRLAFPSVTQGLITLRLLKKDFEHRVDLELKKTARTLKVDGFRPGKVPLSLAKQYRGEQVRREVTEAMLSPLLEAAIDEKALDVAGDPHYRILEQEDDGEAVVLAVLFEFMPEIALGPLSSLEIELFSPIPVTEEDTNRALELMALALGEWGEVSRPARRNDRIELEWVDPTSESPLQPIFFFLDESKPKALEIFEGIQVGDTKKLPEGFSFRPADDAGTGVPPDGQQGEWRCRSVFERVPMANFAELLNDGVTPSPEEFSALKEEMRKGMTHHLNRRVDQVNRARIFQALRAFAPADFPVPSATIQHFFRERANAVARHHDLKRLTDPLKEQLVHVAVEDARMEALTRHIAKVYEQDFLGTLEQMVDRVNEDAAGTEDPAGFSRQAFANPHSEYMFLLRRSLRRENVAKFIVSLAKVTEKPVSITEARQFGIDDDGLSFLREHQQRDPDLAQLVEPALLALGAVNDSAT